MYRISFWARIALASRSKADCRGGGGDGDGGDGGQFCTACSEITIKTLGGLKILDYSLWTPRWSSSTKLSPVVVEWNECILIPKLSQNMKIL